MAIIIEELRQRVQLERRLIAQLKTANIRFTNAQVERIWAIVSAHQAKALLPLPPTLHRW